MPSWRGARRTCGEAPRGLPNFIGAFIGMACQDRGSTGTAADFDWFAYRERAFEADPTIS
ncbi:hypothetical protein [Sphingomonas trueperi]|uniref:beta-xylosidase family glycoside hydrolase n=1 Tax=Sphingomonas trueperi TaxID=53317 RepID=UPI001C7D1B98